MVARLRDAGAIFIGKTNLHEFALGTTNEDSAYGPVRHPLDRTRSPGGSSGGSAASVLADMAYASIGTDTGGSIRIPAAACGLVGLKPTIGEIPTDGVVPLSATLDHVGPLCRSVEDAALAVRRAPRAPRLPRRRHRATCTGLRFGVPARLLPRPARPAGGRAIRRGLRASRGAGARARGRRHPAHAETSRAIYLHIVLAEAAAYHAATLESRPEDYTTNVRLRLEMGRYILAEDYVRALRGREVLTREVDAALAGRDALLLPSLAVPATRLGAATVSVGGAEEPVRNITLRLTQLFNVTGHPAISLPCGKTSRGPADRRPARRAQATRHARARCRRRGPGRSRGPRRSDSPARLRCSAPLLP